MPLGVIRGDCEIVALVDRCDQFMHLLGRVLQVIVHRYDDFSLGDRKSTQDGVMLSGVSKQVSDLQPGTVLLEILQNRPGVIRAAVINEHDFVTPADSAQFALQSLEKDRKGLARPIHRDHYRNLLRGCKRRGCLRGRIGEVSIPANLSLIRHRCSFTRGQRRCLLPDRFPATGKGNSSTPEYYFRSRVAPSEERLARSRYRWDFVPDLHFCLRRPCVCHSR